MKVRAGRHMDRDRYTDQYIAGILAEARTIAMVGASAGTSRPSYFAMKYLLGKGYEVIPVNPNLAGKDIQGRRVYASLADIPGTVDIVDIFRASAAAGEVVREAIALKDKLGIEVIWMQLGVRNDFRGGRGGSGGPQGGHEPLRQDRVRPAFRRDRLGRSQRGYPIFQAPPPQRTRRAGPSDPGQGPGPALTRGRPTALPRVSDPPGLTP